MTRKLRRYKPLIGFNFLPKNRIFKTKNTQRKVPVIKPRNKLIVTGCHSRKPFIIYYWKLSLYCLKLLYKDETFSFKTVITIKSLMLLKKISFTGNRFKLNRNSSSLEDLISNLLWKFKQLCLSITPILMDW